MIWDVLSGSKILSKQLNNGGILHVSAVLFQPSNNTSLVKGTETTEWMEKLDETSLLVSFEEKEAQIFDMKNVKSSSSDTAAAVTGVVAVPVAGLEGTSRGARLLTGQAAASTGQRVAPSPCGNYIASAARGVVCLLSAHDLSILDAVKVKGVPKKIKTLQFDLSGKQLLVGTTDKSVRIYNIVSVEETDGDVVIDKKEIKKGVDMEYLIKMAGGGYFQEGSFIHQKNTEKPSATTNTAANPALAAAEDPSLGGPHSSTIQLKLTRLFEAQVEKLSWGACAFSPDGKHLVTAIDPGSNEHVIYTWNIFHGYAENTLQAGSDGIVELSWHPEPAPMQCLAVTKSGRIYIWAKVMTQDWSAFAPDFETLTDNREHVEEETEFDVEIGEEDDEKMKKVQQQQQRKIEEQEAKDEEEAVAAAGKKKKKKGGVSKKGSKGTEPGPSSTHVTAEDEEVDIESWEWLKNTNSKTTGGGSDETPPAGMWTSGWSVACTAGPLLHLPVIWPTEPIDEPVVEEEMEVKEEEREENVDEEAVPMAVDDDSGSGKEEEKGISLKEGEEDGEEAEKSKKARIE